VDAVYLICLVAAMTGEGSNFLLCGGGGGYAGVKKKSPTV